MPDWSTTHTLTAHAKIGLALLALAVGLAFAVSVMWRGANEQAASDNRVNGHLNVMTGGFLNEDGSPNHTPSFILLGAAALAVVSAVPSFTISSSYTQRR